MSILIKGLEMPKKGMCIDIVIFDDGTVVCYDDDDKKIGEAVELPDHGDLIERDRLHHDLKADAIDKFAILDDTYLRYLEGLEKAEELLLGATVVIPAERSEE